MPPKIRELIEILKSNNFQNRGGKGGHKNFLHQSGVKVTVSSNPGDNAKRYQIKEVERAVIEVKKHEAK